MNLIVGLGNPGSDYLKTRHNVGWMLIDQILDPSIRYKAKFKGEYCEAEFAGEKTYFLKPQTYMNLSGESVQPFMNFFKIDLKNVYILHDELDIPFGQVHLKTAGGVAGHNGLKSLLTHLGTDQFNRLRIGIGRPTTPQPVADYVLSPFGKDEQAHLSDFLLKSKEALEMALKNGMTKAGNFYNKKNLI